ncbi:hypothetical protein MRX96_022802 [Rhipicephalus microplus]
MLRARRRKDGSHEFQKRISTASDPREYLKRIVEERNGIVRSKSTASCCARFEHLREDYQMPTMVESQESPPKRWRRVRSRITGASPEAVLVTTSTPLPTCQASSPRRT